MFEIFEYQFMLRAFAAGFAISLIAPLIGTFLVVKRLSLIADTLSHIALAGVAIALLTNTQPLLVTVITTTIAAICIELLRTSKRISGEAVLAMFLPGGLALSLVLLSLSHGFNSNLFSYLFGSISTVTETDLILIGILAVVTIAAIVVFYKQLFFVAIDEESAQVSGINPQHINFLLIILTAITVSLAMRIVGVLLIGALMVIPVVTSMQIAKSFKQSIFISIGFATVSVFGGLLLAYYLSMPAGGVIVLLSLFIFLLVTLSTKLK